MDRRAAIHGLLGVIAFECTGKTMPPYIPVPATGALFRPDPLEIFPHVKNFLEYYIHKKYHSQICLGLLPRLFRAG